LTTYLVTGANRGIGLEYCKQLNSRGDDVIATCRTSSDELEGLGLRVFSKIELTSQESISFLAEELADVVIDVLILNAGILEVDNFEDLDSKSLFRQFSANAISPLMLAKVLKNNLVKGSKVIFMTSRMGSIDDNKSGGFYGYRMSKAALCMAGKSLSIDLKDRGIIVSLLHPGLVKTRMTGFTPNGITPFESVSQLITRIDSLNINDSGYFFHANGEKLPW
tara:strand:- start:412 stop:1077 length:666 start_codon:yes stop_codon:yes gene_type:complete